MAHDPAVTVVVPTYQRAHLLPRLIAALEAQTLPFDRFEVVVVDDASTDGTAAVLAQLHGTSPLALRVVRAERNRGPAAGRNVAWRAARALSIAFTDDDTEPAPGWLAAGLAALGHADVVVGRTTFPPAQLELAGRPFTHTIEVTGIRFYETCNIFYRKSLLEEVGGFDEAFRTPSGEDTELALRILERGARATFAPEALVYHSVRPPSFRATVTETIRWTGLPHLVARHPQARGTLLYHRYFWKRSHPLAVLALAGLLMSLRRRWALGLVLPWVRYRVFVDPPCAGPRRRVVVLPAVLAIDLLEVFTMARGSVRHGALVL